MVLEETDPVPEPGEASANGPAGLYVAESGSGAPVLFLHGQPGLGSDFDPVSRLLVTDHRLIVPDRPGYGRSSSPPVSMTENASVMAQLLRERATSGVTVVGHSYGGGVALLLAARHPDLVSGLVLAGSVGRAESVGRFDKLLALPVVGETLSSAALLTVGRVLPKLRSLLDASPIDLFERTRVSLPDATYVEVVTAGGRRVWRSFAYEQRSLMREIDEVESTLGRITVPTVVIAGEWDVVVPPRVAASIAAAIPGSELVTVERVGHFVPRDAPDAIADAVRITEARSRSLERG